MQQVFFSFKPPNFKKTSIMNDRPNDLRRIRPDIKKTQQFANMRPEERFQNEVLRPILKLQNPLLIDVFTHYITKRKNVFYDLSLPKKLAYIENSLIKDQKFRNAVKGMLIGLFTVEEYRSYTQNSSALNKRMMNLVIERLKDQVQLFDKPAAGLTKVS